MQWKGEKVYLFLKSYLQREERERKRRWREEWGSLRNEVHLSPGPYSLSSLCCRYFSCNQSHDHLLLHDTSLPAHLTQEWVSHLPSLSPFRSPFLAPFSIYFLVRKKEQKYFPLSSLHKMCVWIVKVYDITNHVHRFKTAFCTQLSFVLDLRDENRE